MNAPDMIELIDDRLLERLAQDLSAQRQQQTMVAAASMQPRLEKDAGPKGLRTGQPPSKTIPMAGQDMAAMLQAMQQQAAATGAPQRVQGMNSAM